MLQNEYVAPPPASGAADFELPEISKSQPNRERVRLVIYGSRRAIDRTLRHLHVLNYVDYDRWNAIAPIPKNGITITLANAEAYSFLLKEP